MRIRRFSVEGYKNLTRRIELTDLEGVTPIYGPNDVGKSNLLEALGLPFALIALCEGDRLPLGMRFALRPEKLASGGYPVTDIFTLERPTAIHVELDLEFTPDALERHGIVGGATRLELALGLESSPSGVGWTVSRFVVDGGQDLANAKDQERFDRATPFVLYLMGKRLEGGTWRSSGLLQAITVDRHRGEGQRGLVNLTSLETLYDRQESTLASERAQWDRFAAMIGRFEDILGTREVRATYNRKTQQANLVFRREGAWVPVHLLGTGPQQLIALLGALLTSGAQVATIEEPEANLSFALQVRLREMLAELPSEGGLAQVFFTSHSPGIEGSPHLWYMQPGPGGPTITRHSASSLANVTGAQLAGEAPPEGRAPISWVTEDGLVRLPKHVVDGLGLAMGGGVVFFTDESGFRIVTNATALRELGWGEE